MLNRVFIAIVAAIGISVSAAAPVQAMSISSAARSISVAMPVRTVEFSERAHLSKQLFCLQYGSECGTGTRGRIAYTNKLRTTLASVNRSVNHMIPEIRARREFMSLSPLPGRGDDYAMMKRGDLIRLGLPAGALRVAEVSAADGRSHSVLVVATSNGDFVLDHHKAMVLKRGDSGYGFASLTQATFYD